MEFAIISPTAGLERYAKLSKTHLVLQHEWKGDYAKFYTERKVAGDFIIMDNGAYENGTPELDVYENGLLQPNVTVLPDFPLQTWQKTWHASISWLDRCFGKLDTEWLYIPQAREGDLIGFIESYHRAIEDPRITWIGIPRALAYAITDDPLMRVKFAEIIKRDRPDLHIHAFGMVNGDVHELPYLAHVGVDSIDSSAPIWRGWNGYRIEDRLEWDQDGTPVDFQSAFPIKGNNELIIQSNLEACGVRTT